MRSMTGYGKAVYNGEDYQIDFELKSVNSRFLEIRLSCPRELSFLEMEINNAIKETVNRGKISGRINLISLQSPQLEINYKKLETYTKIYNEIKEKTGSQTDIPLSLFLENEEIIIHNEDLSQDTGLKARIMKVVNEALQIHQQSAHKEGAAMQLYLEESVQIMRLALAQVESAFPGYKEQLNNRLQEAVNQMYKGKLSEENINRISLDLALYVEKADVTEEIVRLKHHLNKFEETINKKSNAGKTLNFILQEAHREVNTMGSKYNETKIFDELIKIKEEVEKCREIVQNLI